MNTLQNEPVVTTASLAALISAFVIFLRVMGWLPITDDQFNALMALVAVALPIAMSFWPRSKVTPLNDPKVVVNKQVYPLVRADQPRMETPQ